MKLSELTEMQKAGAFKVAKPSETFDENSKTESILIAGQMLTPDNAEKYVKALGWTRCYTSPYKAIKFMNSFIRDIADVVDDKKQFGGIDVQFENKANYDEDSSFYRVVFSMPRSTNQVLIINMKHAPAKFTVYNQGCAGPKSKERTQKNAIKAVFNLKETIS